MGQCLITRKGTISKNYVYLDGNKYTIQKGSFPGVSANALPLDGYINLTASASNSGANSNWASATKALNKNGVELINGNAYASHNGGTTLVGMVCSAKLTIKGYVSFITAYGFSASALASANVSDVTVNYWLKKAS